MNPDMKKYLEPTEILDSNNQSLRDFAEKTTADSAGDTVEKAVALYYAVRDGIWYDPYSPFFLPEHYRASQILKRGRGYCVGKASLLCALGRTCGIPARIGFADVKNHLATRQLIEYIGTDVFVYHGYVEFYLNDKWVKATPAFNAELCKLHAVEPLEFNGHDDSIFHAFNSKNKKFMEYLADHGVYADIPVLQIVDAWKQAYGKDRVEVWIKRFNEAGGQPIRNFLKEEVWKS